MSKQNRDTNESKKEGLIVEQPKPKEKPQQEKK
jgi:hypothetical protein